MRFLSHDCIRSRSVKKEKVKLVGHLNVCGLLFISEKMRVCSNRTFDSAQEVFKVLVGSALQAVRRKDDRDTRKIH